MKGKSIAVQIITTLILLIGYFGNMFDAGTAALLAAGSYALTAALSTFAPSGVWVKGWNVVMWATNIVGVATQILNYTSDNGLVAVNVTAAIITVLNIILQVYFTNKVNANVNVG